MLTKVTPEVVQLLRNIRLNQVTYALSGAFLLFLCSQISIPLEPVPITLQTFGIMLVALTFERKAAIHSVLLYLTAAMLGAPVLANFKGGFACFIGPTGGYLLGFLVATAVISTLRLYFKRENILSTAFICIIGSALLYCCGITWLCRFVGMSDAFKLGLFPFIVPGIIKIALLALALRYLKWGRI